MRLPSRFLAFMAASPAALMLYPQLALASTMVPGLCAVDTNLLLSSAAPAVSRLDMIRMQQEGALVPAPSAVDLPPTALPQLCVLPLTVATLPAAPPLVDNRIMQPTLPSDSPDVFGSVAVAISHTPLDLKWQSASQSQLAKGSGPWAPLVRSATGQGRADQLEAVNKWVNARVRFTNDRRDQRGADRWAGASETLRRRRGDCEDYAIAKMKLLEAVGVARTDMFLVVVDDLVRRADHALLIVRHGEKMLVLDNGTDEMLDARDVADYRPIFSYGYTGAWIHGYAEKPVRLASLIDKGDEDVPVVATKI
jgi:predicted transglutaminase-like cysteine proteinase